MLILIVFGLIVKALKVIVLFLTLCFLCEMSIWQDMRYPPHHLSHSLSCCRSVPAPYLSSNHILTHCHSFIVKSYPIAIAALLLTNYALLFLMMSNNESAMCNKTFVQDGGQFLYWYLCKKKKQNTLVSSLSATS